MVSAVIIFHNEERFLAEAIESVLAQTFSDWELLLVDDGSTDGSLVLAQGYQGPKVRVLSGPRQGMSAARNRGIAAARGSAVAFLDGDDVWLPAKLATQVAALERFPGVDVVLANSRYWRSWSGRWWDRLRDRRLRLPVPADQPVPGGELMLHCYPLGKVPPPFTCDLLVRRSLLERIGGFVEEFAGLYEDQAFLAKAYLEGTFYVVDQPLSRYRKRSDSCCPTAVREGRYPALRASYLRWLRGYLRGRAAPQAVEKALRKAEQAIPSVFPGELDPGASAQGAPGQGQEVGSQL